MKRIFSVILAGISLLTAVSCAKEIPEVIDEISLGRCLSPTNVTAKIQNGEWVVLNWDKSKAASVYTAEFFKNEEMTGTADKSFRILPSELPVTVKLEADEIYYLRVQAASEKSGIAESKWYVHDKSIVTTAIKTPLNPEIVDRSSQSITMKWEVDSEVDHIRIEPSVDGKTEYTRFEVTPEIALEGQAEVAGLNPSTYYSLTVHFKSAERGTVRAWTRPSMEGATEVASTDALKQALADGATKIVLTNLDTPYFLSAQDITGDVEILGQTSVEGTKPSIYGSFTLKNGTTGLHLEGIDLNGAASPENGIELQNHLINVNDASFASDIASIKVVNCDVHDFQRGIMYDNSKTANYGEILFDGVLMKDISGNGGDFFDLRKSGTIGSIRIVNSTLTNAARTLIRIDKTDGEFGLFELSHCTLNDLVNKQNSNNNGILHIRKSVSSLIVQDNLFLNMVGDPYCQLISHNTAAVLPTEIYKNYFYNCQRTFTDGKETGGFFYHKDAEGAETGAELLIANGGAILSEDPCEDSGNGTFNLTNETLISQKIGDPRWLNKFIVIPEDLTHNVTSNTPTAKTWDFSDSKTFYKAADKDMVRDGIRFYVKSKPVVFQNGLSFSEAGAFNAADVENSDCVASIKVNQPGSVVVSTESNGNPTAMLVVSLDGKPAIGIPAGSTSFMVTFADITEGEEHLIFFYGTDAITISALQWNNEIQSGGDKKLKTPEVTADKTEVTEGKDESITLSWEAVEKAASYGIILNGSTTTTTELSYAISTKNLTPGDYEVGVFAAIAEDDKIRENSDTVSVNFTVKEVLKKLTGETTWAAEYMSAGVAKYGNGTELTADFVYGNLGFVAGGGKFKFGIDNAGSANEKSRVQLGGTGKAGTKSNIQLIVGGNGTLKVTARSSGETKRALAVAVGATDVDVQDSPDKASEPEELVYSVTAADGDTLNIYSKNSGINLYSITWTPGAAPAPVTTMVNVSDFTITGVDDKYTVDPVTFVSGTKKWAIDSNNKSWTNPDNDEDKFSFTKRAKSSGKSTEGPVVEIAAAKGAVIEVWFISSSSSEERRLALYDGAFSTTETDILDSASASGSLVYTKFTYNGNAGKAVLGFPDGAINIYGIRVTTTK